MQVYSYSPDEILNQNQKYIQQLEKLNRQDRQDLLIGDRQDLLIGDTHNDHQNIKHIHGTMFVPNILEVTAEIIVLKEHLAFLTQKDLERQAKYDSLRTKYNYIMELFLGLVTIVNENAATEIIQKDSKFSQILRNYYDFAEGEGSFFKNTKKLPLQPVMKEMAHYQQNKDREHSPFSARMTQRTNMSDNKVDYLPARNQSTNRINYSDHKNQFNQNDDSWKRLIQSTFNPSSVKDSVTSKKGIFDQRVPYYHIV